MRFAPFLLSTCAAVCLTWPAAVLAAPPGDRGPPAAQADQQPKKDRKGGDQPAAPAAKGAAGGHQGQAGGQGRGQAGAPAEAGVHGRQTGQAGGAATAPTVTRRTAPAVTRRPPPVVTAPPSRQTRVAPTPSAPAPLSGWDRSIRGPAQVQLGQQWRSQHHNWDQSAPWRGNTNWWRSDPGFRLFHGPRMGFFFFPGFGYIAAPAQYQNHYWRAGDYLPNWFWRYTVKQYGRYGLPRPPDGCSWIWLDGDVALVDLSDGFIIDIVYNVW